MKSKLLGLPMAAAFFSIVSLVQVCQACFSRTVVFSAGGDVAREPPEHRRGSAVHAMLAALVWRDVHSSGWPLPIIGQIDFHV